MQSLIINHPRPYDIIPYKELVSTAERIYKKLNKIIYNGRLNDITIEVNDAHEHKRKLMATHYMMLESEENDNTQEEFEECRYWGLTPDSNLKFTTEISINPFVPWNVYRMTSIMAHEMIHVYTNKYSIPDNNSHGETFKKIAIYQEKTFGLYIPKYRHYERSSFMPLNSPNVNKKLSYKVDVLVTIYSNRYITAFYKKNFIIDNINFLQQLMREEVLRTSENYIFYVAQTQLPQVAYYPHTLPGEQPQFFPISTELANQLTTSGSANKIIGSFDLLGLKNINIKTSV